jgi:hypothetical protein
LALFTRQDVSSHTLLDNLTMFLKVHFLILVSLTNAAGNEGLRASAMHI